MSHFAFCARPRVPAFISTQLSTIIRNNCSEAAVPYCRNFFQNKGSNAACSEEAMHVAAQQSSSSSSSRKSSIVLVVLVAVVAVVVAVVVVVLH